MERDDALHRLDLIRKQRQEAVRAEADLAREEAEIQASLSRELDGDTATERAAVHELTRQRLEESYGRLRTADDLEPVIHAWRQRIPGVSSLWSPVRGDRDHVRGEPAAPVVVVEYGDYQCPECAEAHGLAARLKGSIDDGRLCVAWRHFPLVDAHPLALRAAQAAEAAAAQGMFWELHDVLMRHQIITDDDHQQYVALTTPRSAIELEDAAHRAGLDVERFRGSIDDPAALERILDDFRGGLASGVNGTPTYYINGRRADINDIDELYDRIAGVVSGQEQR
jgi:protein-disulfide isomerase